METLSYIFRPRLSGLIPLAPSNDIFNTKLRITSLLARPFIDAVLIRFYEGTSHMRQIKSLMNATWGHVAVIFLVMLLHRRSYMLVTFGLPFFETLFSMSRSAMHAKFMIVRLVLHLLHCILLSPSNLLQNRVLTS